MTAPAYSFPAHWAEKDLESLPEDGHRYEIIDGSLLMSPPASFEHQSISFNLGLVLHNAAPPEWLVRAELGLRVPSANLVPDLVVLRPKAARPGQWQEPDGIALVVEIASRSTQAVDSGVKTGKFAAAGIPSYWQVKQDGTIVEHTDPSEGRYQFTEIAKPGTVWTTDRPFPISFDPAELLG